MALPKYRGNTLEKSLTLTLGLGVARVTGSHLVVHLSVPPTPGRRGGGGQHSRCTEVNNFTIIFVCCADWYGSQIFYISGEEFLDIGLCLVWLKVTIFSLSDLICYSIILGGCGVSSC